MSSVRAAAFRLLLETGEPVTTEQLADETGRSAEEVIAAVETLDAQGMARLSEDDIVGTAGLSVVPTSHEVDLPQGTRWTWCALDAVAILAALEATGDVRSASPATGREIRLHATDGTIDDTDVVIFVADRSADVRVVDDWCPTVNFFEDASTATVWAAGRVGAVLPASEVAERSAPAWAALLEAR